MKCTEENAQQKNGPAPSYNPWPGYMFTGKLRPHPVVSLVESWSVTSRVLARYLLEVHVCKNWYFQALAEVPTGLGG